jgi:hypothetical protein
MDQQLNRLLEFLSYESSGLTDTLTPQDRINVIDLIKFLLSENTQPISIPTDDTHYNANLYFHGWLFPQIISGGVATGLNLIKYPYIGLFHPFGSIHAVTNRAPQGQNVPLNNLIQIQQYFHDALSPKTSFIHIDRENDGKAYTVCVDWDETNRPGVRLAQMRGIVTLLIYISNTIETTPSLSSRTKYEEIQNSFRVHNTGLVGNLLESLSRIKGLYKILNTWEIDLFKQKAKNISLKSAYDGLILFDYREGGDKSKAYWDILKICININTNDIPYIDEIKSKLDPAIFTPDIISNIAWEFEIHIVYRS